MWTGSHSLVTKEVTKEQMWKLFSDVNNWQKWDTGIDYAKMEGEFEVGNFFQLKPKGSPEVKIKLIESIENKKYVDLTHFPLAKMTGTHLLEETPDGIKMTTIMRVWGLLSFLWVKLVAKKIVDDLSTDMNNQVDFAKKL